MAQKYSRDPRLTSCGVIAKENIAAGLHIPNLFGFIATMYIDEKIESENNFSLFDTGKEDKNLSMHGPAEFIIF